MDKEFPDAETDNTIRVMFKGLPDEEKEKLQHKLAGIEYVDSVDYDISDKDYNKEDYTMYVVNTTYDYDSGEVSAIEESIVSNYTDYYDMVYSVDKESDPGLPAWIMGLALGLLMIILLLMSNSWVEPFLFLATIAVAVVINMGTNAFLPSVSETTYSIAAILQLALSMDYSIILINRFRQELKLEDDKYHAMKNALVTAFSSIASSSVTTIVGLLALVFMRFKIGADMGIVLAKGVFISMICIFTVLPALILMFHSIIRKTSKKELAINMNGIGAFSYKFRHAILGVFLSFICFSSYVKGKY